MASFLKPETPRRHNGPHHKRPHMPRPPRTIEVDMFAPFRHIENEIEQAYWGLTQAQRAKVGELLYTARELLRGAGDTLPKTRKP